MVELKKDVVLKELKGKLGEDGEIKGVIEYIKIK